VETPLPPFPAPAETRVGSDNEDTAERDSTTRCQADMSSNVPDLMARLSAETLEPKHCGEAGAKDAMDIEPDTWVVSEEDNTAMFELHFQVADLIDAVLVAQQASRGIDYDDDWEEQEAECWVDIDSMVESDEDVGMMWLDVENNQAMEQQLPYTKDLEPCSRCDFPRLLAPMAPLQTGPTWLPLPERGVKVDNALAERAAVLQPVALSTRPKRSRAKATVPVASLSPAPPLVAVTLRNKSLGCAANPRPPQFHMPKHCHRHSTLWSCQSVSPPGYSGRSATLTASSCKANGQPFDRGRENLVSSKGRSSPPINRTTVVHSINLMGMPGSMLLGAALDGRCNPQSTTLTAMEEDLGLSGIMPRTKANSIPQQKAINLASTGPALELSINNFPSTPRGKGTRTSKLPKLNVKALGGATLGATLWVTDRNSFALGGGSLSARGRNKLSIDAAVPGFLSARLSGLPGGAMSVL